MKIMNLEIKNIRGIKTIKIQPEGHNVVIFGPNGAGKSALVDAIDFLFTGKISRLTGEGTKFLKLKEHGCHVDSRDDLKNTVVIAKIEVDGKNISLMRSIHRPRFLQVKPKKETNLVKECLERASFGIHLLSRREILRYITSEAGQRAKAIMSLLNLGEIERQRSDFVFIRNDSSTDFKHADSNLEKAKSEVVNLLSLKKFSEKACLDKVNSLRIILNAPKIPTLIQEKIKDGVEPWPFGAIEEVLTTKQIENTIEEIRNLTKLDDIILKSQELEGLLEKLDKEAALEQYISYKRLIDEGISLVGDKNVCPLYGRKWKRGSFRSFLIEKQKEIEIASGRYEKIDEISGHIKNKVDLLKNDIILALRAHKQFKLEIVDEKRAEKYMSQLDSWSKAMLNPLKLHQEGKWPRSNLEEILSNPFVEDAVLDPLDHTLHVVGPQLSAQQIAWDTLTKMEDRWKTYQETLEARKASEKIKKMAQALLDYFVKARNSILSDVYDAVEKNFERYYKSLHSEDESGFCANISPKQAELVFEVEFYNQGMFPPHALHSEGHQDSMDVCLFFALNKYLVKEFLDVIILDDVIMSIDSAHRRNICRMLRKSFPSKQFIITTHDATWAKQLKTECIVTKKNMFHFLNWNIDTGPMLEMDKDLWDKIKEDLTNDDVPSAAHKLRRNAECFFDDVCDFLRATGLPYTATRQWDLGEFASAAISTYKKYLRRAIANAKKMDQNEKVKTLEELENKANEVIKRSAIEQWAINKNVHYSRWEEFHRRDFEPVVEAFKDLFNLFVCSSCGSMISHIRKIGRKPEFIVTCNCGEVFWNVE